MEDNILPASLTSLLLGLVFHGLERSFTSASAREGAISRACDEGINLDLLHTTDIARELTSAQTSGDFPLVCVKGVVKTYEHDVIRLAYLPFILTPFTHTKGKSPEV